jgi:hypothetical protein
MLNLFIGSKSEFGCELIIQEELPPNEYMGFARLWLGGKQLGTIEDYIHIRGYLANQLISILAHKDFDYPEYVKSKEDLFNFLKNSNKGEYDSLRCSFGTMSDDFLIWAYRKSERIFFLWRIIREENKILFNDIRNYDSSVQEYDISVFDFTKVVIAVDRILSLKGLTPPPTT